MHAFKVKNILFFCSFYMDKIGNLFEGKSIKKVVVFNQKLHSNTLTK
ncbi:hypothetical protein AM2_0115 [Lactococcus cremoris]|nr:hypothetical protein AM2_0115 [Lactococcus cremoris]